jgi:hypothetical protein
MLQSLDALIAFAVVFTGASTFVTVMVQIVSAGLSLRGKNLANALALTLQTIDPKIEGQAHALAAHLLSDPLLSDSIRPDKDRGDGKPLKGISDRTEAWSAWNPGWFGRATRLANAARPEEIYSLLQKFAKRGADLEKGANLRAASAKTTGPTNRTKELQNLALSVLNALGTPAEKSDELNTKLAGAAGHALDSVAPAARERFGHWFGMAEDRAQQWFQLNTRIIAIIVSAIVALLLQLDALDIYQTANRAATSHDLLAKTAEQVSAIAARDHALLPAVRTQWHANHPNDEIPDWKSIKTADDLERELAALPANQGKDIHKEFTDLTTKEIPEYYKAQRHDIDALANAVGLTGYEILPPTDGRWPGHRWDYDHLFGTFAAIALLTLGAPYWYNLLKNLTSLRPALAKIIGQEETAQQKTKP